MRAKASPGQASEKTNGYQLKKTVKKAIVIAYAVTILNVGVFMVAE